MIVKHVVMLGVECRMMVMTKIKSDDNDNSIIIHYIQYIIHLELNQIFHKEFLNPLNIFLFRFLLFIQIQQRYTTKQCD